jgi:hypothetical protein
MRSEQEQIAGLKLVAAKLGEQVCNCMIEGTTGKTATGKLFSDVAILYAPVPGASQIVYAEGDGYDIWDSRGQKMLKTNVSLDEAVAIVTWEYKTNKINIVMERIHGKDWYKRKSEPEVLKALAYVSAQVMDNKLEKFRSETARQSPAQN